MVYLFVHNPNKKGVKMNKDRENCNFCENEGADFDGKGCPYCGRIDVDENKRLLKVFGITEEEYDKRDTNKEE